MGCQSFPSHSEKKKTKSPCVDATQKKGGETKLQSSRGNIVGWAVFSFLFLEMEREKTFRYRYPSTHIVITIGDIVDTMSISLRVFRRFIWVNWLVLFYSSVFFCSSQEHNDKWKKRPSNQQRHVSHSQETLFGNAEMNAEKRERKSSRSPVISTFMFWGGCRLDWHTMTYKM